MNAPIGRTVAVDALSARDILVQALAGNADPKDANEVLDYALGQLGYQITTLQSACNDGLLEDVLNVQLIILRERIESLQKFVAAFLDLQFAPLDTPEATDG